MIRFGRDGTGEPLFCIHPAGGYAWQFASLASMLDRPVVGLQLPQGDRPGTFDELVEHHVRAVRREQPRGPYRLLGYSFGGTLAHAMAAMLTEAGETIAFVGLVDSEPLDGRNSDVPAAPARELPAELADDIAANFTYTSLLLRLPKHPDTRASSRCSRRSAESRPMASPTGGDGFTAASSSFTWWTRTTTASCRRPDGGRFCRRSSRSTTSRFSKLRFGSAPVGAEKKTDSKSEGRHCAHS